MSVEQTPSTENLHKRVIEEGIGFEELGDTLAMSRGKVIETLREQRPLYLVTHYTDQPETTKELVKDLLVNKLGMQPAESELVTPLHLNDFDDQLAQTIIDDKLRPIVLPIIIGPGENPAWRVGPLWMLYSMGNVQAFREQLRQLQQSD